MQGRRDQQTGLYTLYMPTTSIQLKQMTKIPFLERFCSNNANKFKSKQDIILSLLSPCMFFSTKSTWIEAIKNSFFTTWPGFTF